MTVSNVVLQNYHRAFPALFRADMRLHVCIDVIILITSIYFIAISGLPAHCQFGRFILLAQKKLLSFRAEISAAKLIFADPCKRFVLVRKLDFFHFKLDKAVLFQDAVAEFPIVKDTTPNMMNPRLYTTSYNKP